MHRTALTAGLLLACGEPPARPVVVPGPPPPEEQHHVDSTGPVVLAADPLVDGWPVDFHVRPLAFGDAVEVFAGSALVEPTCPPAGSPCLSLEAPVPLGAAVADHSRVATLTVELHARTGLALQAVVTRSDGTTELTPALLRPLVEPAAAVPGDLVVRDATELAELGARTHIMGDLDIRDVSLESLRIPGLEHVGGDVKLWGATELERLELPALRHVGGDLSLYDLPALTAVDLSALTDVGGALSINRVTALRTLEGFAALQHTGDRLYLFHNPALLALGGLASLRSVGRDARIWEQLGLLDADLPALEHVGGELGLFRADALVVLDGYGALHSAGGLDIRACPSLERIQGLAGLRTLGGMRLHHDNALVALPGLAGLTAVERNLGLIALPALTDLGDLDALTAVGGVLEIRNDRSLTSVELPALKTLGALDIAYDLALTELGLGSLETIEHRAEIRDNPLLSDCAVRDLLDRVAVGGTITCTGNLDEGCPCGD